MAIIWRQRKAAVVSIRRPTDKLVEDEKTNF